MHNENTALITISQLPAIEEHLMALRDAWEQRAAEAATMVCTEDTVQDLKKIRAEMRKEFEEADTQRKAAKEIYMKPWTAVEDTFRECVKDAFSRADASLKSTIADFENELKQKCREDLEAYFDELCAMEQIDFISFDDAMRYGNVKISLGDAKRSTPRQAMDQLGKFLSGLAVGMDQISKMDNSPAIMAEFKKCLDVGKAVAAVQERRRREQAEIEAAEARKRAKEEEAARVARVEAAIQAAPVPVPKVTAEDPVFEEFTFTVYGAKKSQLIRIRDFLKQEGIRYA